jgi:ABC-type glycerol-3-phosphate transport system permease component
VTVFVLTFYFSWNDYLFASVMITNRNLYTAGLGLSEFIGGGYAGMSAGLLFMIVPVVMFLAAQRHIAKGLTAGALK